MELPVAVVVYSLAFAFVIKIADLLDEHGLFLFRGADLLFGILWGIAFAFLIRVHPLLAGFWIAMLLYWIAFMKIDFVNHALAIVIIILAMLWKPVQVDWLVLGLAFAVYSIFALMRRHNLVRNNLFLDLNGHMFVLLLVLLFFDVQYGIALLSYGVESVAYHAIKRIAARFGYA
ncbi:MAG TPA: hypothetical protein VJJ75_00175 [Candidatus Nanoarchaeia archaeon]|nr:hypothetical protein [Candidatus Nanoarchaeia archaeon]